MEKKSTLIISASIIIGFMILSVSIFLSIETLNNKENVIQSRYEIISANDNNLIIFDKETGQYWRKFIKSNEGPTEWTKETLPDLSNR